MSDELFVDGISGIGFGKGAVRIDFFAMSAEAVDAKGQPAKERKQRLVMTTEGFVESFALLAGVMEKLKGQGLVAARPATKPTPAVQPKPAAPAAPGTPAEPDAAKDGGGCPSPNF